MALIYSGKRYQQVLDRLKTATARPQKPGDEAVYENGVIIGIKNKGRWVHRVGRDEAVLPGRGKKQGARHTITQIRDKAVGEMTDEQAVKEGMKDRAEFIQVWGELYTKVDEQQRVWWYDFELIETPAFKKLSYHQCDEFLKKLNVSQIRRSYLSFMYDGFRKVYLVVFPADDVFGRDEWRFDTIAELSTALQQWDKDHPAE